MLETKIGDLIIIIIIIIILADSYVDASARDAGSAAELAALRKDEKYSALERTQFFQSIAVESLGPTNMAAHSFLAELGRKISGVSGDDRESSYVFQQISVLIQRYSTILLHEGFTEENRQDHVNTFL